MARRGVWMAFAVLILFSSVLTSTQAPGRSLELSERPGGDRVEAAVPDGAGGIWAVGSGTGTAVTTSDAFQRASAGETDAVLAHIGADGSLLYATYLGGVYTEFALGVARDAAGNVYVVGSTTSPDFPVTVGSVPPAGPGRLNAFVSKFDPTGRQLAYSTLIGGSEFDVAAGVAVDAAGVAHVVGTTQGFGFVTTWGTCQGTTEKAFYVRLHPDGTLLSGTCLDDSRANAVTLDANGDAYVVGAAGPNFGPRMNAVKVAFPSTSGGQAFLAKFSGNSIPFSTYIGGAWTDWANDVAVTAKGIYIAGAGTSIEYPGAPPRNPAVTYDKTAWVTKVRLDGQAILGTTLMDGSGVSDEARSLEVDASEIVHVTGWTDSADFPITVDAMQPAFGGVLDAFYAAIWMPQNVVGDPSYLTYLGGSRIDRARGLALDGTGGAWLGGETVSPEFPLVNAQTTATSPAFVARFGEPREPPPAGTAEIVLYAGDASSIAGNWQPVADTTAAGGTRLWNPDQGVPKITTPAAHPATYFELTFEAAAGVPYHLWLRMKADDDHWMNDSVWVQFSDSVDAGGTPIFRIGTTSGTVVSLEDCSGCGVQGWGWNDNGYGVPGPLVRFASSGTHTIRIQQREDGISVDQVVLSSVQWASTAPGANKNDTTIHPKTEPPPPPPPAKPREIVLYAAQDAAVSAGWTVVTDSTAAGGARLFNPDQGVPKLSSPAGAGNHYFEVQFTADAGIPYRLWIRSQALNDHWTNDSVFVQFSNSVDGVGTPIFRIGSDSATIVSLEDCGGCGEQGWGWNDNGYNTSPTLIYFATSGPQTIRVLRREDGISIDQIVLSSVTYMNRAPGTPKNDSTIVPK